MRVMRMRDVICYRYAATVDAAARHAVGRCRECHAAAPLALFQYGHASATLPRVIFSTLSYAAIASATSGHDSVVAAGADVDTLRLF